jgi:pimeloyl-ACP methyl ester carboxylesterase
MLSRNGGAAIARSLRGMAVDRSRFTREALEPYARSFATPEDLRGPLAYYRHALKALLHPREGMRRRRSYGTIERPGLLLWAEEDRALGRELVPPHVDFVRDLHVRRVPHCGHFVQQEQPEVVNETLGWWLDATRHAVPR